MNAQAASELNWAIDRFVSQTPGVISTQTVSSDGMHLAAAGPIDEVGCDQMAAICSGLASLTDGATELHGVAPASRMLIEAATGWIIVSRVSDRATLAVVAEKSADIGMIGFEMTELGEMMGHMLSPGVIEQLKNSFAVS